MSGNGISDGYRVLTPEEVAAFDAYARTAWQDESLPWKQYFRVVSGELEVWKRGDDVLPYRVAIESLKSLPIANPKLLDCGASSGYYSEVLRVKDYECRYTALDYSESFKRLAVKLFPGIAFDVGDALALPYMDKEFDVVLHGACLMHLTDYKKAISEAVRVTRKYLIFHRTSINTQQPTTFYYKEAYGVPCVEAHFSPTELEALFKENGLRIRSQEDLFTTPDGYGHRTYVCEKN